MTNSFRDCTFSNFCYFKLQYKYLAAIILKFKWLKDKILATEIKWLECHHNIYKVGMTKKIYIYGTHTIYKVPYEHNHRFLEYIYRYIHIFT